MSPEPLKRLFQWSDDEGEASGYALSTTVSSVHRGKVSANMANSSNDDLRRRMEAQEQTTKAQQEALDNIQQMLAQLLTAGMIMLPEVIIMRRSIMMMNNLRLRSQKKALPSMPKFLKASKLKSHP